MTEGVTYPMSYGWDIAGNMRSMTLPSERTLTWSYDNAARATEVTGAKAGEANKSYATGMSYAAHGGLAGVALGNGMTESWGYNSRLQPREMLAARGGTTQLGLGLYYCGTQSHACGDNNGNPRIETIAIPGQAWTRSFGYDGWNRVSTASEGSDYRNFGYSATGNMWVTASSAGWTPPSFTPRTWGWYDAKNRLVNVGLGVQYDTAGTQYLTADPLGSVRLVTDASGNVVSRHDYLPFGEEIPAGVGGRTTAMGYVANPAVTQKFTGKERDAETGLDYFGARYFSGAQGRFTSPDAFNPVDALVGEAFDDYLANPQYWNKYAYSLNNPLKYKDSDGHLPHAVGGALVGGGVGGALELYSQIRSGEDINWAKVATKTGLGAAVGATAAATFGASLLVQTGSLAVVNTAAGIADRSLDNDATTQALDQTAIVTDAIVGGAAGLVGGVVGKQTQTAVQNSAGQKLNERIADHGVRATTQRSASRQAAARYTQQRVTQHPEAVARRAAGAGRAAAKAGSTAAAQRAAETLKKGKEVEEEERR